MHIRIMDRDGGDVSVMQRHEIRAGRAVSAQQGTSEMCG